MGERQAKICRPGWGAPYGGVNPAYLTPDGPVWLFRKGQKTRFYDDLGRQVGPEQANVAPAVAYALHKGWQSSCRTQLGIWEDVTLGPHERIIPQDILDETLDVPYES